MQHTPARSSAIGCSRAHSFRLSFTLSKEVTGGKFSSLSPTLVPHSFSHTNKTVPPSRVTSRSRRVTVGARCLLCDTGATRYDASRRRRRRSSFKCVVGGASQPPPPPTSSSFHHTTSHVHAISSSLIHYFTALRYSRAFYCLLSHTAAQLAAAAAAVGLSLFMLVFTSRTQLTSLHTLANR